jgi:hypothetical protein
MVAEEFQRLIANRPVLIRLSDGREYFIEKDQNVMVGDFTAGFLVEDKGVKRNAIITLSKVVSVTPCTEPPKQ